MTAQHTPGPWKVVDGVRVEADTFGLIASIRGDIFDPATRATARLIAAAPAMLAALQVADGWIDAEREGEETGEGQQARWILDTIRAAIAAATGGATGEAEAPAASPTDEPADDCEAIRTLEQAAACVRDGLVLLDTVDYVDDSALEDGRLCVVPAEGPAFNIAITMQPY